MKPIRSVSATIATLVATALLLMAAPPAGAVISGANGRIVFVSDRDGDNEIYAMRSDGTGVVQLTTNTANDTEPSVSHEGLSIAFISDRDGGPDLYTMNIDGTNVLRLTTNLGATVESHPSWAPSKTVIAFAGLTGTDSEIFSIKPNGGAATNLTNDPIAFDANPSWSPGGIKIAFDSTNRAGNTGTDVYTMVNNGTGVIRLTTDGKSSNPSWFPDNKTLTYESAKDNGVPGPVTFVNTGKKPVGLAVTSTKVLYTEWNTDKVKQVSSSGVISNFATLPANGLSIERYIAISPGFPNFPKDDVYVTVGPNIYQITPDGLTVTLCKNIPELPTGETGITFDTVGTFGNKMILTDRTGPVWTLDACGGTATNIANFGVQIEGPLVAPMSFAPYGGWLLGGNEFQNGMFAIDPITLDAEQIPDPSGILDSPEGAFLVPPTVCNMTGVAGAYFIAMKDSQQIQMFDASNFTNVHNDVLGPSELNPSTEGVKLLHSNGSSIELSTFWGSPWPLGTMADLEGSAFAQCGAGAPARTDSTQVAGPHEVYKINTTTLVQTRLTNNPADDINPAVSPNGATIVFQSDRDNVGSGDYEIYKMNSSDGSAQTNISNNLSANDITPDWQTVSFIVSMADFTFTPATAKPKLGGSVLWDNFGPSTHTATDNAGGVGMGLFDSGFVPPGGFYTFRFTAAGSYPYICTIHPQMTGTVKAPMTAAPLTGNLTTVFTITWASNPILSGYNADIQILRPGATDFVDWRTNQSGKSAGFTPDGGTGTYSFRARLQRTSDGIASDYSTPVTITVNP